MIKKPCGPHLHSAKMNLSINDKARSSTLLEFPRRERDNEQRPPLVFFSVTILSFRNLELDSG